MTKQICAVLLLSLSAMSSMAETYEVTQMRAAQGKLPELIEKAKQWQSSLAGKAVIMRHSQGDQWDLMLLAPVSNEHSAALAFRSLTDYQMTFLATSDMSWAEMGPRAKAAGMYHIEMFHAGAGKHKELLKERAMENAYLANTGRAGNAIFEVTYGSDVDSFTVGFHKNLQEFAKSPGLSEETSEKAAVDAGFANRADISFYLRRLIVGHHDTVANQVK